MAERLLKGFLRPKCAGDGHRPARRRLARREPHKVARIVKNEHQGASGFPCPKPRAFVRGHCLICERKALTSLFDGAGYLTGLAFSTPASCPIRYPSTAPKMPETTMRNSGFELSAAVRASSLPADNV
jgi:hypothetical protein